MIKECKDKISHLSCGVIIVIYCALKPIYLFGSGSMQICDYFLILAFLYLLVKTRAQLPIPHIRKNVLKIFGFFIVYQLIINSIFYIIYPDTRLVLSILFFCFNFLAFYIVFMVETIIGSEQTIRSFVYGCYISVLIASFGALTSVGVGARNMGWFNNPNQLGYFALLIVSVALFFRDRMKKINIMIMFASSMWLILVSASKAAFLGVIIMLIIYVLFGDRNRDIKHIFRTVILLSIILAAFYLFFYSNDSRITSNTSIMYMRNRIIRMSSEEDSNLGTGRGYYRLLEMGTNFIWGMGEGAYYRFQTLSGKEVHSTFVSLIVSYGWFGFGLVAVLFYLIVKKKGLTIQNLSCISGLLLYFVTHNGIRNTLFWLFLAAIYISNNPYYLAPNFTDNQFDLDVRCDNVK